MLTLGVYIGCCARGLVIETAEQFNSAKAKQWSPRLILMLGVRAQALGVRKPSDCVSKKGMALFPLLFTRRSVVAVSWGWGQGTDWEKTLMVLLSQECCLSDLSN